MKRLKIYIHGLRERFQWIVSFVVLVGIDIASVANATATDLPLTLNLTPYNSTYNAFAVQISINPEGLGTKSSSATSYGTGTCPINIDATFDPTTHQATIQSLTAPETNPGSANLTDSQFPQLSWTYYILGVIPTTVTENASISKVVFSLYTPSPPTLVSGGQFDGTQQQFIVNGGSLNATGAESVSQDLGAQPIDGTNYGGNGSIVVGNPTMNGAVATYPVSFQMPISVYQTFTDPDYTGALAVNGTLQATAQFQFNFGPRSIYWNAGTGDFSSNVNWDTGFAPRNGDTVYIQNGGTATVSTAVNLPATAVTVGGGGAMLLTSPGSLNCSSLSMAGTFTQSGLLATTGISGSGTLLFNGGMIQASASNSHFLEGLSSALVQGGGQTFDTQGYTISVAQSLLHDPTQGGNDGGLTKVGSGTLVLSGTNNYSGGTTVKAGTLVLMNANSLLAGSSLIIGSRPLSSLVAGAQIATSSDVASPVAAVPEPGTLALLLAGTLLSVFATWRNWTAKVDISSTTQAFPRHRRSL